MLSIGLIGVLASSIPGVLEIEEAAGLDWLFERRGVIDSPQDVVLISIDTESADSLGLRPDLSRWPRALHAELVRRLHEARAAVVVFDIIFDLPRNPVEDADFAEAVGAAGNVVLLERLRIESHVAGPNGRVMQVEQRDPPIPELRRAALATAPFPLPRVPIKVSQFPVYGPTDPNVPTLPAAALLAYSVDLHETLLDLVEALRPGTVSALRRPQAGDDSAPLSRLGSEIRNVFRNDPLLGRELFTRSEVSGDPKLRALIATYAGPENRYLNFYGPARTIATVPYHAVLADDWDSASAGFDDKVVFVGFAEENPIDQLDEFYTAFSETTGVSLSGAEIGATAFANLLGMSWIRPLPMSRQLSVVLLWGVALGALVAWLPAAAAILSILLLVPAYAFLASQLFQAAGIWLPIVVPVLGQTTLALVGMFGLRYVVERSKADKARRTLSFYLPPQVVDQLSRNMKANRDETQLLHGTCISTDAERYTSLSERLAPRELHAILNSYYEALFLQVEKYGGFVADVVGDSMVAVWAGTEPNPATRADACRASAGILGAVDQFNAARPPQHRLPTRIGVHSGQVLLGNVGAESHFEYRAVGDIVNTASRIQGLNKQLGTNLLVSDEVLQDTECVLSRRVGRFLLAGKTVPHDVYDMVSFESGVTEDQRELVDRFAAALKCFEARDWRAAADAFEQTLARFPVDGPSRFYLRLCREYAASDPGSSWSGVIVIPEK